MSFEEPRKVKLGEIGVIITGKTPPTRLDGIFGEKYPFVTPRDMIGQKYITETERYLSDFGLEKVKKQVLDGISICVSCIGTLGKVALIKGKCVTNQQINSITKIKNEFCPDYIYYQLKTMRNFFDNIAGGSTMPIINKANFAEIELEIPNIRVQKKVSSILSKLDEKIELNNQINRNLEEMTQAIFKRWFVDFEFPNENGEPYKSSGGEFEESELGLIPKGWFVTEMGSFLIPKNERVNDKNLILYSTTNQGLQLRDEKFKKNLTKNNKKNKIIEKNDIVFGMSREILNFGVMKDKIGAVSPAYHVFKVDSDIYNAELLEMYMRIRSDYFLDLIKPGAREGQVIDRAHLQKKRLIVPKKEIQDHFYEVFSCIKNTMQTIEDQTNLLIQIRDTLLPKLMSGEIRVPLENEGRHQDEQLQRV
jgi:type I restriction enzyme, S subunit